MKCILCLRWPHRCSVRSLKVLILLSVAVLLVLMWKALQREMTSYPQLLDVFKSGAVLPIRSSAKHDDDYLSLLRALESKLNNFAAERKYFSSLTCDKLKESDTSSPCHETDCPGKFSPSARERLDQILATRKQLPSDVRLALDSVTEKVPPHKYVFVTAASREYYGPMQALLNNMFNRVFPRMAGKDFVLILFDLGLTKRQRELTEKHCRCTVLDFPFAKLPTFIHSLKCYTWKPLIVASLLKKADYLVWMDSSIRWEKNVSLDTVFQRARERGFQVYLNGGSIAVRTNPSMTDYFGDAVCQYAHFSEFDANFFVLYNDRFNKEVIIAPWVTCALNQTCMCLPNAPQLLFCSASAPRVYGRCHRFDQSALSILFSKLLLDHLPSVIFPRGVAKVMRGDSMNLFKSL